MAPSYVPAWVADLEAGEPATAMHYQRLADALDEWTSTPNSDPWEPDAEPDTFAPDVVSVEWAAERLGVTPDGVKKMLRRGAIEGRKLSERVWIVSRESVETYKR